MSHSASDVQHGMGETGHFGEFFVALAVLMFIGGAVLFGLGLSGFFGDSFVGAAAAETDAVQAGFLFLIEGIGFAVFGVLAILMGWGRHHADAKW